MWFTPADRAAANDSAVCSGVERAKAAPPRIATEERCPVRPRVLVSIDRKLDLRRGVRSVSRAQSVVTLNRAGESPAICSGTEPDTIESATRAAV